MFFRRVSTPIEKEYQKHMSASQELTGKETSDYLCYGCPPTLAEQRSDQVLIVRRERTSHSTIISTMSITPLKHKQSIRYVPHLDPLPKAYPSWLIYSDALPSTHEASGQKYLSDYHHNDAPVTKVPKCELFLLPLSQSPSLCVLF
jgi:hypothetical protein